MNYIVDDIGAVIAAMRLNIADFTFDETFNSKVPYYMYGHRMEISNRLTAKNNDKVKKHEKYPVIALKLDTPEVVKDGVWHYNLNLAIITYTDRNYNAEERYANVFKPKLYPLYELFLRELRRAGLFMWPNDQQFPEHTKIDRLYWGTETKEGNAASFFNDPLDAIELIDLKLNKRLKNC